MQKFIPEIPIYLSTENLAVKTYDQVLYAVTQLRDRGFLCVAAQDPELIRPIHQCFSQLDQFESFKKACNQLNITLKSPIIKPETIETVAKTDKITVKPEPKSSHESAEGHIIVEN